MWVSTALASWKATLPLNFSVSLLNNTLSQSDSELFCLCLEHSWIYGSTVHHQLSVHVCVCVCEVLLQDCLSGYFPASLVNYCPRHCWLWLWVQLKGSHTSLGCAWGRALRVPTLSILRFLLHVPRNSHHVSSGLGVQFRRRK